MYIVKAHPAVCIHSCHKVHNFMNYLNQVIEQFWTCLLLHTQAIQFSKPHYVSVGAFKYLIKQQALSYHGLFYTYHFFLTVPLFYIYLVGLLAAAAKPFTVARRLETIFKSIVIHYCYSLKILVPQQLFFFYGLTQSEPGCDLEPQSTKILWRNQLHPPNKIKKMLGFLPSSEAACSERLVAMESVG